MFDFVRGRHIPGPIYRASDDTERFSKERMSWISNLDDLDQ